MKLDAAWSDGSQRTLESSKHQANKPLALRNAASGRGTGSSFSDEAVESLHQACFEA